MGRSIYAKIGYGYIITSDIFPYPEDNDENKWILYSEWKDKLLESDYIHIFDEYYDNAYFFGIILQSAEIYAPLDFEALWYTRKDEWEKCNAELLKFFPNGIEERPMMYLLTQYWD